MDAKLKKIAITPMKFDKHGEVSKEEFATITIEVPMDSIAQRDEIAKLLDLLAREWMKVEISDGKQLSEIPGTGNLA